MKRFSPLRGGFALGIALLACAAALAADKPGRYLAMPADWFRGDDGRRVIDNVLSYQALTGSWPKNVDCTAAPYTGAPGALHGTFDNGATTDELRLLARALRATDDARCRAAFDRGLEHVLRAQYPNGGWPQHWPPGNGYARYITFNDGAMVRLMTFLREVSRDDEYAFVDAARRRAAGEAFDRGIECILRCQVRVGDVLTVWCAQHDEQDLSPRPARTFELASLSGSESVGIVKLLMSLDNPSPRVVESVDAAVAWFERARLTGLRQEYRPDPQAPGGQDKVVVPDAQAGPLWARFYALDTNKPIFASRDGVARERLADISYERRNGYGWLGTWPQELLEKLYPAWKQHHAQGRSRG